MLLDFSGCLTWRRMVTNELVPLIFSTQICGRSSLDVQLYREPMIAPFGLMMMRLLETSNNGYIYVILNLHLLYFCINNLVVL